MADISLKQAHEAVDAALKKSTEMGVKMDIAVVDAGANLKSFARMDGAWLGSIDIAQIKARTARFFDMPTGDIGGLSQPGGPLYNIEHSKRRAHHLPRRPTVEKQRGRYNRRHRRVRQHRRKRPCGRRGRCRRCKLTPTGS